jgi:hypothetical protein
MSNLRQAATAIDLLEFVLKFRCTNDPKRRDIVTGETREPVSESRQRHAAYWSRWKTRRQSLELLEHFTERVSQA